MVIVVFTVSPVYFSINIADTGGLEFHLYCDKDKHPQSQTKGYGSYDESKDDCGLGSTSLDLLMFRVPDEGENWMDYWVSGLADRTFCCTAKMVEDGKYD